MKQLEQMKTEAEDMFTAVSDYDQRAILRLRYLESNKIDDIADAIGISRRNAYKLFRAGKEKTAADVS